MIKFLQRILIALPSMYCYRRGFLVVWIKRPSIGGPGSIVSTYIKRGNPSFGGTSKSHEFFSSWQPPKRGRSSSIAAPSPRKKKGGQGPPPPRAAAASCRRRLRGQPPPRLAAAAAPWVLRAAVSSPGCTSSSTSPSSVLTMTMCE